MKIPLKIEFYDASLQQTRSVRDERFRTVRYHTIPQKSKYYHYYYIIYYDIFISKDYSH